MYTTPRFRLHGGTLLGFAAGLLLGLALALAVALYVTRSATPLEERNTQRPAGSAALEAEQNRNWNPNAGLSTRPAAPAALPGPEAAAPAAAPAAAGATPTAPAADPLAQLIEQRMAAVVSPPAAAAVAGISYFVQAGAFGSAEEAQAQRARLAMLGLDASVSERQQNGRPLFRVRLGPFATQAEADAIGQRLQAQNVDTALVRVAR
ncbi:MAG: SPOR domain-containing protein [Pseudomonadota bacterium]|jgi:cell division protein FtsN